MNESDCQNLPCHSLELNSVSHTLVDKVCSNQNTIVTKDPNDPNDPKGPNVKLDKKKKRKKKESYQSLMGSIMTSQTDRETDLQQHKRTIERSTGGGNFKRGNLDKI